MIIVLLRNIQSQTSFFLSTQHCIWSLHRILEDENVTDIVNVFNNFRSSSPIFYSEWSLITLIKSLIVELRLILESLILVEILVILILIGDESTKFIRTINKVTSVFDVMIANTVKRIVLI
jgi:hypothetical protein